MFFNNMTLHGTARTGIKPLDLSVIASSAFHKVLCIQNETSKIAFGIALEQKLSGRLEKQTHFVKTV